VRMLRHGLGEARQWTPTTDKSGAYVRSASTFREWVSADGSTGYKAEAGRYHLYVSLACPWACRTLLVRNLKVRHPTQPGAVGVSSLALTRRGCALS
jgi:glutathionyl-hydroquinone reductase